MNIKNINYTLWFWVLNISTALLKIIPFSFVGLYRDEGLYWAYSQYLDISYFDHPPLVGYLIGISCAMFGNNEFSVRLPAVLSSLAAFYLIFILAKEVFKSEKIAFLSVVLLNFVPGISFIQSTLIMPDSPLTPIWILSILFFWRAVNGSGNKYWYLLGVAFGFGLLSKYTAVLLILSVFLFLILSSEHRVWLKRKEPYIASFIGLVMFTPVILWNMQNSWASFSYQILGRHGHVGSKSFADAFFPSLAEQAGYISPLLFILFWIVLFWLGYEYIKKKDNKLLLFISFAFPTLILFNFVACFKKIMPHWPIMGYMTLGIPAVYYSLNLWKRLWFKVFLITACLIGLFLTLIVPVQTFFKVVPSEAFLSKEEAKTVENGVEIGQKIDTTNNFYGWKEVGAKVSEIIEKSPDPKPFVFAHYYEIAGRLQFYIKNNPRVYLLRQGIDEYDVWQRDLSSLQGRNGIFVCSAFRYTDPTKLFPFESWETPQKVEVYRGKDKVRAFWIYVGNNFHLEKLGNEFTADELRPRLGIRDAIIKADHDIFWFINKKVRFKVIDYVMIAFTKTEDALRVNISLIFIVFVAAYFLWRRNKEIFWKEFLLLLAIVAVGGIFVYVFKDFFGRVRPLGLFGDEVNVFYEKLERIAFPSGHTQIAFGIATFLASRFKKYTWLLFTIAALMGLSRIYVGSHFPLDVLAGAILGIAVALPMIKFIKIKPKTLAEKPGLTGR
ncbi:glycosyltransferase family 39 protein [Elusimicrobiota bacterium]